MKSFQFQEKQILFKDVCTDWFDFKMLLKGGMKFVLVVLIFLSKIKIVFCRKSILSLKSVFFKYNFPLRNEKDFHPHCSFEQKTVLHLKGFSNVEIEFNLWTKWWIKSLTETQWKWKIVLDFSLQKKNYKLNFLSDFSEGY